MLGRNLLSYGPNVRFEGSENGLNRLYDPIASGVIDCLADRSEEW